MMLVIVHTEGNVWRNVAETTVAADIHTMTFTKQYPWLQMCVCVCVCVCVYLF